ncbi:uncharacterized protein LOC129767963 isoform X2 [Toxorhynchites rutilus septentrionalis]|uniref:uncharacterized protein LOC129767963 isoform X2 n=1 Tax=Toxorhynchites rutilus septentrionalis TaxID=329112 RepID=UPI00247A02BA|nr:uncharacterized protein LOC129767963 isoform X2 [Toxorhynchites rutilus septentrionalis]
MFFLVLLKMEGFDYVVKRPPQARVCFGSGIQREAVPLRGPAMSPLMRRIMPKSAGKNVAPGSYNITYFDKTSHPALKTVCSSRGFGSLSATSVRFTFDEISKSPGVGDYTTIKPKSVEASKVPFGAAVPRWKEKPYQAVPGAGTYTQGHRKEIRKHSFGGKIRIIPATMTICKTNHFDRCYRCEKNPIVDYWKNLKTERCLCRDCMVKEIDDAKYRSKTKSVMVGRIAALKEYKRVRHCSYYHKHDKTAAAIQFVTNQELKRKFRVENYLSMFE